MCPSPPSRRDFPIVTDSFGQLIDTETWHCLHQTLEEIWPFWEFFWFRYHTHILAVVVEINGVPHYLYRSEEAMYFSHLFFGTPIYHVGFNDSFCSALETCQILVLQLSFSHISVTWKCSMSCGNSKVRCPRNRCRQARFQDKRKLRCRLVLSLTALLQRPLNHQQRRLRQRLQ